MGSTAARHLSNLGGIDEIVLADKNLAAVQRVAAAIAAPRSSVLPREVDLLDPTVMRPLLESTEIVLNCAGPFFRLAVPALLDAITTGTTYVDICDDPEPTAQMLALHETARSAGVCAVIGMGASPGLSNLLAVRAAKQPDTVEDCFTAWPLDVRRPGQTTAPVEETPTVDGRPSAAEST